MKIITKMERPKSGRRKKRKKKYIYIFKDERVRIDCYYICCLHFII